MKHSFLILAVLLLLPLAACKDIGQETAQTPVPTSTPAPYEPGLTYHEVYDPDADFDNRLGRGHPGFAESEDAYYYISSLGNYIYYYDKLSGERGVLCGKPECVHDELELNEDCSGLVRAGAVINYYEGKLYYVGYSNFGDSEIRHSLYRENPDGTGRERLFPFTCDSQHAPGGGIAIHRGKLYGWGNSYIVDSAVPKNDANCSCWDLETGEQTLIYERSDEVSDTRLSVFAFGKYIYICDSYFYPDDPDRGTTVTIMRWNTEVETLETVYSGEGYSGRYYSIWVEAESRIFFAPTIEPDRIESSRVYLLSDGEVSTAVTVDGNHAMFLLDGAFAFLHIGKYAEQQHALITDYDGNVLYEGSLSFDVLSEIQISPENVPPPSAVYGSSDAIYIVFTIRNSGGASGICECIVRYDLGDGKIVDSKLLCVSKW
jgi:hypothetical protein